MTSIGIIGTGNVGFHLLKLLSARGTYSLEIYGRNSERCAELAKQFRAKACSSFNDFAAELIFVCVPDEAIHSVVAELPKSKSVILTAGTSDLSSLNRPHSGVFYPMQTFSASDEIQAKDYPIFVTATDEQLLTELERIGQSINKTTTRITDHDRLMYHITAVWVNNFSNHLLYQAQQFCQQHALDWSLFFPLIDETIEKMKATGPFHAQTGPARRTDNQTISRHLEQLSEQQRAFYQLFTDSIQQTYTKKNGEL